MVHNAGFGIAETERVIDTLVLARRKHPGSHNTLDDLCSRDGVNSLRSKHGALLDAELLAAVHVELISDRQAALQLAAEHVGAVGTQVGFALVDERTRGHDQFCAPGHSSRLRHS